MTEAGDSIPSKIYLSREKSEYGFYFLLLAGAVVNACSDGVVEDTRFGHDNFLVPEVHATLSTTANCFNCESSVAD